MCGTEVVKKRGMRGATVVIDVKCGSFIPIMRMFSKKFYKIDT